MPRFHSATLGILLSVFSGSTFAQAVDLRTISERSGFKATGRYEEVERLCAEFPKRYPKRVKCIRFGETPEGRPMLALAASQDGVLTAATARAKRRPIVFFQGGIHAGEIDGKDAGFLALKEWLDDRAGIGAALSKVTVLFVPVFNVDGHERFGPHNRPNQNGPEQMGWRTTAQNYNLNRDYMKVDTPEMQAMLKLLAEWDPLVMADLHVTDGAQFQHEISINVAPSHSARKSPMKLPWEAALNDAGFQMEQGLQAALSQDGHLPIVFYPSFVKDDDPSSGFEDSISPPRFSQQYWALHHRIGILVETHSWKDYATRVRATHDALIHMVELTARNGAAWMKAALEADEGAARQAAGYSVALEYGVTTHSHPIGFLGYHYSIGKSEVSGQNRVVYDTATKETWEVPLFDELKITAETKLPKAGYIVPAAHAAWVAPKLSIHGIHFEKIKATGTMDVEAYRATETKFGAKSYEGHQTLKTTGAWGPEKREVHAGSLFVPIAQPRAVLIAHLLEPAGPDSLLAWGFFNPAFERKEYMENYVTEDVARAMLKDSAIRSKFEQKLGDPEFAKSPDARLEFFYRLHPSWDERFNLYPVLRVATRPH